MSKKVKGIQYEQDSSIESSITEISFNAKKVEEKELHSSRESLAESDSSRESITESDSSRESLLNFDLQIVLTSMSGLIG